MTLSQKSAMLLEYEGTHFHGWQLQDRVATVQQVVEQKLAIIMGQSIRVYGACRTDAGVHALAQVAHFSADRKRDPTVIQRGLNALLPASVSVVDVVNVHQDFHARHDARGKTYSYRIWNDPVEHTFLRRFCHCIYHPLDWVAMNRALKHIVGEHDFSAFRAASCGAKSPVRTVFSADLNQSGPLLTITISGNAFLQYMVRIIVGTLIEIGGGKRAADSIASLLAEGNRIKSGMTAPAKGLALEDIRYEQVNFQHSPRKMILDTKK